MPWLSEVSEATILPSVTGSGRKTPGASIPHRPHSKPVHRSASEPISEGHLTGTPAGPGKRIPARPCAARGRIRRPHPPMPRCWRPQWSGPGGTRTHDTRFRRPVLCPLSYGPITPVNHQDTGTVMSIDPTMPRCGRPRGSERPRRHPASRSMEGRFPPRRGSVSRS